MKNACLTGNIVLIWCRSVTHQCRNQKLLLLKNIKAEHLYYGTYKSGLLVNIRYISSIEISYAGHNLHGWKTNVSLWW